jgi:hypothetical protein
MPEYTMPLLGWFLYVGVPFLMMSGTLVWYWSRQRTPNSDPKISEEGESA